MRIKHFLPPCRLLNTSRINELHSSESSGLGKSGLQARKQFINICYENERQVTLPCASVGGGGMPWALITTVGLLSGILCLVQCNASKRFCLMAVSPEPPGSIQKHQTQRRLITDTQVSLWLQGAIAKCLHGLYLTYLIRLTRKFPDISLQCLEYLAPH